MQRLVTLGGWNRGVFYFFYFVTFAELAAREGRGDAIERATDSGAPADWITTRGL